MPDNVNVLDVLRDYCAQHGEPDDFSGAVAMLAELIAADIALDKLLQLPAQSEPVPNFQAKVKASWLRRAAALSACTGGPNG